MSHDLKRRLIGATVLISLAIIFLPMLLEHEPLMVDRGKMAPIPEAPDEKFKSGLISDEVPEDEPQTVPNQGAPAVSPAVTEDLAPAAAAEIKAPAQVVAETVPATAPDPVKPPPKLVEQPAPKPVEQPPPKPVEQPPPKPVEQPAPKPLRTEPQLSAWVIQVGSFSNQENARKLVERLRKAGLDTMDPQPAVVNGKQLYRVKVGPELDKGNAEKLLPKVKQAAGLQGTVIRYP